MNERGLKVLEQYDFQVINTRRGRGAFLCETNQGLKQIAEYHGTGKRLLFQNQVLERLREQGCVLVDRAVENSQGELISKDRDETAYVVKDWFEGRECDAKNTEDIKQAVRNLARLHKMLQFPPATEQESYIGEKLGEEYERRTREIKKTFRFMRQRRQKNSFESCFLRHYQEFLEQARTAQKELAASSYTKLYENAIAQGSLCHGDYNHHQLLFTRKGVATTNFNRCRCDVQLADLYQFLRKILEKQDWNPQLGQRMLEEYDRELPLGKQELAYLKIRLCYPEKFWKLANYYYHHNKAWMPEKNVEKLEIFIRQQEKKDTFLKILDL